MLFVRHRVNASLCGMCDLQLVLKMWQFATQH